MEKTIIIISFLIGMLFSYWGHKVGYSTAPSKLEEWIKNFISFSLSALVTYGILFYIFIK